MADLTLIEAVNLAMASEMRRDPSVVVLGEDIGRNGGVFRATLGLLDEFGPDRVIDTPLAETLVAAMAIGLSTQGIRAVAEIQFSGFMYPCVDQVVNHATRYRNRTRGRLTCPMVIRAPNGGGIHAPEHHSESLETTFAHMPGLRVVAPSSPARAYGLLLAAIRDPDPVIFLEPTRLYRLFKTAGRRHRRSAAAGHLLHRPLRLRHHPGQLGRDDARHPRGRRPARGGRHQRRDRRRGHDQAARPRHHPRKRRQDWPLRDHFRIGPRRRLGLGNRCRPRRTRPADPCSRRSCGWPVTTRRCRWRSRSASTSPMSAAS